MEGRTACEDEEDDDEAVMRTLMMAEEERRVRGEKVERKLWRRFDVVVVGVMTCAAPFWASIPLRLRRPSRASRRL